MKSKIVNWGRWVVAGLMAYSLIGPSGTRTVSKLVEAIQGRETLYPVYMDIIWYVFCLTCAWGIVRWRRWAYITAIVIFVLDVVGIGSGVSRNGLAVSYVAWAVILSVTFVWLLLPSVRAEYLTRNQTA